MPPKADQHGPAPTSPTGIPLDVGPTYAAQHGEYLTTAGGTRLRETDISLKAGPRGPILLRDHHLREKITHFDHERIPERVVHARGAAAHGHFEANGAAERLTCAAFLRSGAQTPVFLRFSNVVGSRGSMDTARDTRGFATKFYTEEGIFDLVGNNMAVFFIQDGIKFPDLVHAVKPNPSNEIPQAQSAHDGFWDFVSLRTEAQAHTMWQMSDRGIPRSYRMMEGFGVHTFRLVNADGATSLVKWHWKPASGVHSLTWEEAQLAAGNDPDYLRRDLADAIESGAFPSWDLGVQVFPDTEDQMFDGIDLLDPTKFVPEELAPVQIVGTMTLDANPVNYFAETEQVAFHPGHLVRGIDVTNDPLLQARLFSYIDTQLTRLAGPNFEQIPINRTHAPVNDMLRDGSHQSGDQGGAAPYHPNSLDAGCPFMADDTSAAFIDVPEEVAASHTVREQSASFDDHFSQATLFYRSLTPVEREHVAQAYSFELGKCFEQAVKERQLGHLANIDDELAERVAAALGIPVPESTVPPATDVEVSPALSQVGESWPVAGRRVALVVDSASGTRPVKQVRSKLLAAGVLPVPVAPHGGQVAGVDAQRTYLTAASIEFDAIIVLTAAAPGEDADPNLDTKAGYDDAPDRTVDPRVEKLVGEFWRHSKSIGAIGGGLDVLPTAGVAAGAPGVHVGNAAEVVQGLLHDLEQHRVWQRFTAE
ncbi:catalase [Flexivirga endophytica]|uniref:Catalase n=1 Tax=Flexivirga endophytica TaxID=1849103 RepID=A0A916T9C7_9MICO|nr:catalase [Flexivirga endophytica]GGB35282.1 catalase [Flexivirga endophytica]GHB43084.1 catalase [Flexivirga endophytica]